MHGLMQQWPLLCHKILDYAASQHGKREIVSRSVEGPIVRTNYTEARARALKVAQRLQKDGFTLGDRIATLAWNTARHLEVWYGIMGIGAIYHTLNPRLFPQQIAWIMNHAEDRAIFVDLTFLPIVEAIADKLPELEKVIVLTDSANMPATKLTNAVAYEDWIGEVDGDFAWHSFDEKTAAGMCYTSGTTGDPKGVVYSHRSNVLHALISCQPDALGIASNETIMPVVPMFHANAWGIAHTAPMVGATLVMPGGRMDGEAIYQLLDEERVSMTAAVPTVWLMLLQYLEETGKKLPHLNRVVIGGSACPRSMTQKFQDNYGVDVVHAWGMTELSPLGTTCRLKASMKDWPYEKQVDVRLKQGTPIFGCATKIVDDDDAELPHDGKAFGRLLVKGPWVVKRYYRDDKDAVDDQGWFDTGDIATIDEHGYVQITDRAKDLIKSGGEWISSVDLENEAMGHDAVSLAAVIGVAHPKWEERPLLVVKAADGRKVSKEDMLDFLRDKVAKWWLPDDVVFVDDIPMTATGKISKLRLREQLADYSLPGT